MAKHFRVLALAFLTILMFALLAARIQTPAQPKEAANDVGIGGDYRICLVHSGYYHTLDPFIGPLVSPEDFAKWYVPLRAKSTSPHGECLINVSTFMEHFGITREQIQQLIDDTRIDFVLEYNLDILFSGDRALIEAYYDIKNEELHAKMAYEREDKHFSEELMRLQRIVNKNASMSRYYHDVWTYASFVSPAGKRQILDWMQGLIESGQYDRVNIVELVINHERLSRESFESFATKHNMHIFTHYNLDVIFSGDPRLVAEYYSMKNESRHTMQVRAAFEQFVSKYGQPDLSWRLD